MLERHPGVAPGEAVHRCGVASSLERAGDQPRALDGSEIARDDEDVGVGVGRKRRAGNTVIVPPLMYQ